MQRETARRLCIEVYLLKQVLMYSLFLGGVPTSSDTAYFFLFDLGTTLLLIIYALPWIF